MKTHSILTHENSIDTSREILQEVFSNYHPRNFSVRFWDGTEWAPEAGQDARFTIVLQHPGALRAMFLHLNEITLGEAYAYDDCDFEGDLEAAFEMAEHLFATRLNLAQRAHLGTQLLRLPSMTRPRVGRQPAKLQGPLHSKERDRQAVTYHYDVSNEFFALWLDKQMVYSCAYFVSPDEDLETAQHRKLDYVCRKLRLQRGERLLDIGCGWGGLIIHAAKRYDVTALGITLSDPQAKLANEQIRKEKLQDRCRAEVRDYRDLDGVEEYDKIVSIGMFEHVGASMLTEYFERTHRLLKRGGIFLNHGIAAVVGQPKKNGESFSDRYIFPDSQPLPLNTALGTAESCGFEVRDVESLREHYALTLRHWLRRLEAHHDAARSLTDEPTYRIWRLNHAGAAWNFQANRQSIYQTLFVKPDCGRSNLPLTRADWYN